jgi:MFS family permease
VSILRGLLRDSRIRAVELAFGGFNMAEYGVWVSVLVYAYERSGVTVAAVIAVAQLLPAAVFAPLAARTADRRGGAVALRAGYWLQAGLLAITSSLLLAGAPAALAYAGAILAASAVTITRPAQASLLPVLVRDHDELTAVNVLSGWVENLSVLAGPALAGLMITVGGPGTALAAFAALVTGSALAVTGHGLRQPRQLAPSDAEQPVTFRGGLQALRDDHDLVALVLLLGAQYLVIGVLDVVLVVLAISVLGLGASGAGYLNAAFGAGGVLGSVAALSLIGRNRLVGPLLGAAAGWAVLLVALGAWPTVLGAFLLLAAAGTARSVLDVSGRTILLRAAPEAVRARLFGLLEGLAMLGLALGSILVPLLVSLANPPLTLVAVGVLLSAVALMAAGQLRRIDAATPAVAFAP